MPARLLALLLCMLPVLIHAKQDKYTQEDDLDLFEFLALYDKKDEVFIDAEIDEKMEIKTKQVTTSKPDE